MRILPLTLNDLHSLSSLLTDSLPFETITYELVFEKTFADAKSGKTLYVGCFDRSTLLGAAVGMAGHDSSAWVRYLAVHPKARNKGIGSLLLKHLERAFKRKGCKTLSIGDCPENYLSPGLDHRYTEGWCFLKKHGYEITHTNLNLKAPLSTTYWSDLPARIQTLSEHGIIIRRAKKSDKKQILAFIADNWSYWKTEVVNTLSHVPISTFIAINKDVIIGFSSYQGNNATLPWFGPIGTSPSFRQHGIGGILLQLSLNELAKQGFHSAIIPWVGPVRFYTKYVNATNDRTFYVFRKSLL